MAAFFLEIAFDIVIIDTIYYEGATPLIVQQFSPPNSVQASVSLDTIG